MLPHCTRVAACAAFLPLSLLGLANLPTLLLADQVINFNGLQSNANNSQVQSYLQSQLTSAGYGGAVTVTGAVGGNGYNGEGHVVGPISGGSVHSMTLGSLDGGNFIMNDKDHGFDQMTMSFSQPIYGAKFDFEI